MSKFLIYLYDGMADFEVTFLAHLLGGDAGKELITIADSNTTITSKSGLLYTPHDTVSNIHSTLAFEEYEGLIIPGGWYKPVSTELLEIIKTLYQREKLLAAICAGPRFLAKADILSKSKYTTSAAEWTDAHINYFNERDPFPRYNYTGERVTRDKNVITAIGVAFVDFAIEVCDFLGLFATNDEREEFIELIKGTC